MLEVPDADQGHSKGKNLWEDLLAECSRDKKAGDSTLVVLGDRGCGKSMLVKRFQATTKSLIERSGGSIDEDTLWGGQDFGGYALSHTYLEGIDPEEKDIDLESLQTAPKISVWALGDTGQKKLLKFAFSPQRLDRTVVMICLDFSKPWSLVESFTEWMAAVEEAVGESLSSLSPADQKRLKENVKRVIATYHEPSDDQSRKRSQTFEEGANQVELPLPEEVLTKNLGVGIVVVGCKLDSPAYQALSDTQLDVIQARLRKLCLRYGAALFYTSARSDTNCGELQKYIVHRLYRSLIPFNHKPQLIERHSIRIPSGYDSRDLIEKSFVNLSDWEDDESYQRLLPRPAAEERTEFDLKPEITVDDEQAFLDKLAEDGGVQYLESHKAQDRPSVPVIKAAPKTAATLVRKEGAGASSETAKPALRMPGTKEVNENDLASFFSNLLNRSDQKASKAKVRETSRKEEK